MRKSSNRQGVRALSSNATRDECVLIVLLHQDKRVLSCCTMYFAYTRCPFQVCWHFPDGHDKRRSVVRARPRRVGLTPPSASSAPRRTGYSPRDAPCGYRPTDDRPVRAFDARPGGSYRRSWRTRTRRPREKSAVDSDVVDTMGGHPIDARSRVDLRADDVPDGINAADHTAGLSSSLDNLAASVER